MLPVEDEFLERLSRGGLILQDEYDQIALSLPSEAIAHALARRFQFTGETRMLIEAARLYLRAGSYYQVLEVCSRASRVHELQQIIEKTLPHLRRDYPDIPMIGKLLDEAFIVIDLHSGKIIRFPPLLPARG